MDLPGRPRVMAISGHEPLASHGTEPPVGCPEGQKLPVAVNETYQRRAASTISEPPRGRIALFLGETGAGKSTLATSLHQAGQVAAGR